MIVRNLAMQLLKERSTRGILILSQKRQVYTHIYKYESGNL